MLRPLFTAVVFGFATLTGAHAQDLNCETELDSLKKSAFDLEQSMIRKDKDSPLVIEMADGSLADLRGEEPRSQPLESWMDGAKGGRLIFESGLSEVRKYVASGENDKCLEQVDELKAIIVDYRGRLDTN